MRLERDEILAALRAANGNIGVAARRLGASRRTLQNRMREYGIPRGKSGRRKRALPYGRRSHSLAGIGLAAAGLATGLVLASRGKKA